MNKDIEIMISTLNTLEYEYEILDASNKLVYKTNLYDAIKSIGEGRVCYNEKYYDFVSKIVTLESNKYTINAYYDITKYQKEIMMLQEDALTTLPNRYAMELFLSNQVSDNYITVICDLDDFKNINDTYGHLQGDKVLRTFGIIIKRLLSQNAFVGRYGGEEFVMFFHNNSIKAIKELLTSIRAEMSRHEELNNENYKIKVSCGISCTSKNDKLKDSISKADLALYYVKNNGKDADAIYDEATDTCYIIE